MNEFYTYWKEIFGDYEIESGKFSIPDFPEPMMSMDFNRLPGDVFVRTIKKSRVQKESLMEASQDSRFWEFQRKHYPEAVPFLTKLIPFLLQQSHPHVHYFIDVDDHLVASQLVGFNSRMSFLFNGVVHKDFRNRGLLTEVISAVKNDLKSDKAFYWTKNEWLKL